MTPRWAFLGVCPHVGGTWVVFRNLRNGLRKQGIELRWVAAGALHAGVLADERWREELQWGEVVAPQGNDDQMAATALAEHLEANYEGAIANVLCDMICTNLMRYMKPSFPRLVLVHNTTVGTYAAAASIRDHVHATIGVSMRIRNDLIRKHGFDAGRTHYIPNAVPVERFEGIQRSPSDALRILVLSRIENKSKGCFRVPAILRLLEGQGVPYRCTVAGDGPDLDEMKKRCDGLGVAFLGRVDSNEVPALVARHDAYLFPSVYEGFGISLVEAMAGGCVPVSSALKGVTDQIVEEGISGYLIEPTDTAGFALALRRLHEHPDERRTMADAAERRARTQFSVDAVSIRFADAIRGLQNNGSGLDGRILALDEWRYPAGLRKALHSYIPEPIKQQMRLIRERFSRG